MQFSGNFNASIRQLPLNRLTQFATAVLAATPEGGTGNLTTSDLGNLDLPVTIRGTWSSPYAVNMGQQIYLTTPIGIDTEPAKSLRGYITPSKRQYPLVAGAKQLNWDYKITLPAGYKIGRLPENIQFSNAVGDYGSRYQLENGVIYVRRSLLLKQSVVQPEAYPLLEALVYKPINDSRSVIMLEKR